MKYLLIGLLFLSFTSTKPNVGDVIDQLDGVSIFYNGDIENVFGRNVTETGYNLGLKYQCVEFIKRYYYEHYGHEMPYTYGHAKDFYDWRINNDWRVFNEKRGLYQYRNGNYAIPKKGDILVFARDKYNPYGHIGIIAEVGDQHVEIVQQNYGYETRTIFRLANLHEKYYIANEYALGWLSLN